MRRFFLLLVSTLVALPLAAAEPHPFSVHDLLAMDRVSDPRVAPDGSAVAFVVRTTDMEANRGRTDLWLQALDDAGAADGELRRLTTHEASDGGARWSPDGRHLYFVSSRSDSSQIWRLALAGGEPVQVTDLPLDIGNFVLSPDGRRAAFTLDVFVDCADLACTVERLAEKEKSPATGRLYTELLFRHWDSWDDGRRSHLFTLALGPDGLVAEGAQPVDLMAGIDRDTPSQPFGGTEDLAFSADGKSLVYVSKDAGREAAWSTDHDLWLVPADGSAKPVNLTDGNPAWDTQPLFSPDGGTLAWLAMERPGFEADQLRVHVRDLASGEERVLGGDWDRSVGGILWAPDGESLYATAGNVGQVSLFSMDLASGAVETVHRDGHVRSPQILPLANGAHRVLFGMDTLTSPVELYTLARGEETATRLTQVNDDKVAAAAMGEPQQFHFEGWNGERVWGWVVKPVGFEAGERYPVAFLIHGGPQGSFGNDFHYRWNPQTYAGAGYAAVMIDFHGSTGYGQPFTDSISGDWGGKPFEDLQKGLAAALGVFPWLDGERVCALGASYGGYMINWIAGHWPDRFRCLVNHDGLFDHRMMYYTTEELWFPEWEHLGPYHAAAESHEKTNPARFVERWKTPMLVVHGALDYRVPETQGFATFTALQRRGIPSELLYFPDENHWVLQPANSVLWHDTVIGWLDRWLEE
jgi:dipeptidyl aminopeptidase/acylaminoacyl peptidase